MSEFIGIMDTSILSDDEYKQYRYSQIDNRTDELVSAGFVYATKTFSLSSTAQRNLLGTVVGKDSLAYPIEWNTIDDLDVYNIADAAEVLTFYGTAMNQVKTHRDSGTALKTSIRTAIDRAAAEAVIDNR